jgi:hypothetical protein
VRLPFCSSTAARAPAPSSPMRFLCSRGVSAPPAPPPPLLQTYLKVQCREAAVLLQRRRQGPSAVVAEVFGLEVEFLHGIGAELCASIRQGHRCCAAGGEEHWRRGPTAAGAAITQSLSRW